MDTIDKVISGLEICTARPCYCTNCPYKKGCALDAQKLMEDALVLMKEYKKLLRPSLSELQEKFG